VTKIVWKYPLSNRPAHIIIYMPKGAFLLDVMDQVGVITLWAQVDRDEQEMEQREFVIIGTGWDVPDNGIYHGTVQISPYVWHVYEIVSTRDIINRASQ
jgi:hypothetical protein